MSPHPRALPHAAHPKGASVKVYEVRILVSGEAFAVGPEFEIARILRALAVDLSANGVQPKRLTDAVGRHCGLVEIVGTDNPKGED